MSTREAGIHVDPQTGPEEARQALVISKFNAAIDEVVADIAAGKIDVNDLIVGYVHRGVMDLAAKMAEREERTRKLAEAITTDDTSAALCDIASRLAAVEAKIAEIDKRVIIHDERASLDRQVTDLHAELDRANNGIRLDATLASLSEAGSARSPSSS